MARGDPVEFTRVLDSGRLQRVGNYARAEARDGDVLVEEPAEAADATITMLAPGQYQRNVIASILYSYSAAPTGRLTIFDGATLVHAITIVAAGPGQVTFEPPRRFSPNTTTTVTLVGSAGCTGSLSVFGWSETWGE